MNQYHQRWHKIYQQQLVLHGYDADNAQLEVIDEFARIEAAMIGTATKIQKKTKLRGFFTPKTKPSATVQGLYLYGAVGRGKTFLMDLFCAHIPFAAKRIHYHHFMKSVHAQLKQISNQKNPLEIVAANFATQYRIICIDEFMVNDITDAMLLYGLLKSLSDRGVVIVTTTNIAPDDLYKDGLQRQRFLPAIALIKEQLAVHEISQGQDFRRTCLHIKQHFFSPLDSTTETALQELANSINSNLTVEEHGTISINQRQLNFVAKSEVMIRFSFAELCQGYRSQLDYIELAEQFAIFMVTDMPLLDEFHEDAARRFLWLVDELYDRRLELIISSAVPVTEIYQGKKMNFEFKRLQSRLIEMNSEKYGEKYGKLNSDKHERGNTSGKT